MAHRIANVFQRHCKRISRQMENIEFYFSTSHFISRHSCHKNLNPFESRYALLVYKWDVRCECHYESKSPSNQHYNVFVLSSIFFILPFRLSTFIHFHYHLGLCIWNVKLVYRFNTGTHTWQWQSYIQDVCHLNKEKYPNMLNGLSVGLCSLLICRSVGRAFIINYVSYLTFMTLRHLTWISSWYRISIPFLWPFFIESLSPSLLLTAHYRLESALLFLVHTLCCCCCCPGIRPAVNSGV